MTQTSSVWSPHNQTMRARLGKIGHQFEIIARVPVNFFTFQAVLGWAEGQNWTAESGPEREYEMIWGKTLLAQLKLPMKENVRGVFCGISSARKSCFKIGKRIFVMRIRMSMRMFWEDWARKPCWQTWRQHRQRERRPAGCTGPRSRGESEKVNNINNFTFDHDDKPRRWGLYAATP